jgi:formylglycine-generating enzyme required for sulfatase activity
LNRSLPESLIEPVHGIPDVAIDELDGTTSLRNFPLSADSGVCILNAMSSSARDWEPPSPEELQALLPQYEISAIIGRGGMGAVYRGRQAKLNRTVAIKLLPETFTRGEDDLNFAKRFEQEAQAMANLDHPAIISVYDFGETANGQLYFVMEFVDGMDIHQYLHHNGGKLPQEIALTITAHVLDALGYAHDHGIAHRDIKPANILLNHEGRVKIADFGLAKKFGEHANASTPALTLANVAVGTPDFVAPEALDSDQVPDHRADLYAVGVMLYQMLTGKLPRGNYLGPSELDAEIDERLDEIVGKAMATNPDHRYQSAAAVRADLDVVLSHPLARVEAGESSGEVAAAVPVTTSVKGGKAGSTPPKSKTPLYAGLGVGALAVVGTGAFVLFGGGGKQDAARPSKVESAASEPATAPNLEVRATPATPVKVVEAPKPAPPKPVVAEPPAKPVAPKPDPVAVAPPKAPEPVPTPVAAKPAVPTTASPPPTTPKPGETREAAPPLPPANPLLAIPGLPARLDGYLAARRTQLTELATKYGRGLDSRLGQAADVGDLKTASAYTDEKARVEALVKTLATPIADPIAAVAAPIALPDLATGSPETLTTLRQTWTAESTKIRSTLDAALQQSLQALEVELTKARDLEKAKTVLAWRESLAKPTPAAAAEKPVAGLSEAGPATPATTMPAAKGDLPRATKDAPFENSLGMKFVPVPGTDVLFCIHEVRYKDYEEYAKKAKETVDGSWKIQTNDGFEIKTDEKDHPVTRVSWDDAQKFCAWLSEKEGKTYRLPTDQEWSHAVGIGREEDWKDDTTPATVFKVPDEFPWGDEWPPPKGAGNYSDASRQAKAPRDDAKYVEAGYDDGFPTTAPVMSFEANKLGLYDLGGNVWEWCEDWYSGEQMTRVLRGGSWYNLERSHMLSSYRHHDTPDVRNNNNGFRVVVAVSSGG